MLKNNFFYCQILSKYDLSILKLSFNNNSVKSLPTAPVAPYTNITQ